MKIQFYCVSQLRTERRCISIVFFTNQHNGRTLLLCLRSRNTTESYFYYITLQNQITHYITIISLLEGNVVDTILFTMRPQDFTKTHDITIIPIMIPFFTPTLTSTSKAFFLPYSTRIFSTFSILILLFSYTLSVYYRPLLLKPSYSIVWHLTMKLLAEGKFIELACVSFRFFFLYTLEWKHILTEV